MSVFTQVNIGPVNADPVDWRRRPDNERPDDDELNVITDPSLIHMLGFDPLGGKKPEEIEDEGWAEELHPRDPEGKFKKKFGKEQAGGEWTFTPSATLMEHKSKIANLLANAGKSAPNYRGYINELIKEAKQMGNESAIPFLEKKIGESWYRQAGLQAKKGALSKAQDCINTAKALGYDVEKAPGAESVKKTLLPLGLTMGKATAAPAPPPKVDIPPVPPAAGHAPPQEEPPEAYLKKGGTKEYWNKLSPSQKALYQPSTGGTPIPVGGSPADDATWKALSVAQKMAAAKTFTKETGQHPDAWYGLSTSEMLQYHNKNTTGSPGGTVAPPPSAAPTSATALSEADKKHPAAKTTTMPNHMPSVPGTTEATKWFNDKWANQPITTKEQLAQKEADFKQYKDTLAQLKSAYEQDAAAAKKVAAAKEAEKYTDPETKKSFLALKAIGAGHHLNESSTAAAKHGLDPVEHAIISAYTGPYYAEVNQQLRSGSVSETHMAFARALSKSLTKLPPYEGVSYRKATLPADVFKKYKPGYIVHETQFSSTSTNKSTWSGTHQYVIEGKTGRHVAPLSSHKSEAEVLFDRNTYFKVTKVEGNTIYVEDVSDEYRN